MDDVVIVGGGIIGTATAYFLSKEGRKDLVTSIKKEMQKAVDKENYLSNEERILINNFILKIQKELDTKIK